MFATKKLALSVQKSIEHNYIVTGCEWMAYEDTYIIGNLAAADYEVLDIMIEGECVESCMSIEGVNMIINGTDGCQCSTVKQQFVNSELAIQTEDIQDYNLFICLPKGTNVYTVKYSLDK